MLLPFLNTPDDIKNLSIEQLSQVAEELRQKIVSVTSMKGGHLASNLGSVEMILALHYVFSSPEDQIVFDVSHQVYAHKLLTGRNTPQFDQLWRQAGLSGFTNPTESAHDLFYAGHAGTAISLALGLACQRDLLNLQHHVMAVIGDGSLTCGLSLEALNNCHRNLKKFIIILNDNMMSISHNVGSITNILSRLLNNPTTNKWVHHLEKLVSKIPKCGPSFAKQGIKVTESIKNLVSSASFFEQYGFSYIGPIDGHDLLQLIGVFHAITHSDVPIVVHLYTQKGKGLIHAMNDPISYHGVSSLDPITNTCTPSTSLTFPKILGETLVELGKQDPHVVAVSPAMTLGSYLEPFRKAFPDRCFDVGIAEGHAVTFSAGLAKNEHLKVFCVIYATFLQRALDHVFHDVCLQNLPVIFAIDRAGLSSYGPTHHSIYDLSFLQTMPNLIIAQPRNGDILYDLLYSAMQWNQPTVIRYANSSTTYAKKSRLIPIGKGELLAQGKDLLIIALGTMNATAFTVKTLLHEQGIEAAIFDPIFVQPLDEDLLELATQYHHIVVLEEHSVSGGLASALLEFFATHHLMVHLLALGVPKVFIEHGSHQELLQTCGLDPFSIVQRIHKHLKHENSTVYS